MIPVPQRGANHNLFQLRANTTLQASVMETTMLEQFQALYPGRRINEAALFVGDRVVLASQDEMVYEGGLDRFVPRDTAQEQQIISAELWKDADEEKSKLFDLVEMVQNKLLKAKDGASQKTANLRSCKWDEVMSEVKATGQRWKTAPSRTAKARRCLEKLGQNSEALQAWLGLLPAGDYGASICGAFKLAIGAANQYHRIEDCIFEALSDIPEAMENARRYVSIYRDHPTPFLERKTFDLYLAVLKALNHIMQFFADDSIRKFFSALGKQSSYKEELLKSVQEVKKHTVKIKEEALACSAEEQAGTRRKVDQTYIKLDTAEKVLNSIYSLLYDRLGSVKKEQWTALFNANHPLMAIENTTKRESAGSDQYIKAAKRLLKLLQYDSRLLVDDIATCLKLGDILDEESKARAAAMVQSEKLKTWLIEGATSRILLVNGHSDLASAEGQSPLSLVDAELVTISERMESAFVIKYFCGLHTENVDPSSASSPAGLMTSLVGQLLSQMLSREINIDISFIEKSDWKKVEKQDLFALYMVFRELVRQLPPKTLLVCVLDEVNLYETRELGDDTDVVMRRLTRLVANSTEVIIKMVVTCRGRALDFQQYFQEDEILDLDEDVDPDDAALWKIRHVGDSE